MVVKHIEMMRQICDEEWIKTSDNQAECYTDGTLGSVKWTIYVHVLGYNLTYAVGMYEQVADADNIDQVEPLARLLESTAKVFVDGLQKSRGLT